MILRKITTNTLWLLLEKLTRSLFTLFVGAAVIKYLGPDNYGPIAFTLAITTVLHSVANLGVEGVLVRDIINNREENSTLVRQIVWTAFLARLFSGLFLIVVTNIVLAFSYNYSIDSILLSVFVSSSLIFQSADVYDLWNQSNLDSRKTAIFKVLGYLLSNGFRIFLIWLGAPVVFFGFAYFLEGLVVASLLFTHYRKRQKSADILLPWRISSKEYIFSVLKQTWPLIIASVFSGLYMKLDQMMVTYFLGMDVLGVYSVSVLFGSAAYFVPSIICVSVLPILSQSRSQSEQDFHQILLYTYVLMIVLAALSFGAIWSLSHTIIDYFNTDSANEARNTLIIYASTSFPVFIGVTHGLWMVLENKMKFALHRSIGGAFISFIASLFLIPEYGMEGAAVATLVALIFADILIPGYLNRASFLKIFGFRGVIKSV